MGNIDKIIRKVYSKIDKKANGTSYIKAQSNARKYINSLSKEDRELLEQKGANGYQSGDAFVNGILESIAATIEDNGEQQEAKDDASVFTKSMDEISDMDLSQEAVENATAEGAENSDAFMNVMSAIYSDDMMNSLIDSDGIEGISNDEAQKFIKALNVNGDKANFSMDDIKDFFNEINGLQTEAQKWQQLEKESIKNHQGPVNVPKKDFGTSSNPYIAGSGSSGGGSWGGSVAGGGGGGSSYGSWGSSSGGGSYDPKENLKEQIEQYKQEVSDIKAGKQQEVAAAATERNEAKANMQEQIEQDEQIEQELKEQYNENVEKMSEIDQQISECDAQMSQLEAQISQGEAKISTLESSLSSISDQTPSGEGSEAQEVASQIEARKQEIQSEIESVKAEVEAAKAELESLKAQKESLMAEKESMQAEKQELDSQMQEQASPETKEAIKTYDDKKENVETVKQQELEKVEPKLDEAQEKLAELEKEQEEIDNKQAASPFDATFDEMLGRVFGHEGGFVNDPDDHGGATNMGITQATYDAWQKQNGLPKKSVKEITKEEASEIYRVNYFEASGAADYLRKGNAAYAYALLDASINHGVGGASAFDKIAQGDIDKFMQARMEKYQRIIANDPSQQKFAKGWQNRWNDIYASIDPTHQYKHFLV